MPTGKCNDSSTASQARVPTWSGNFCSVAHLVSGARYVCPYLFCLQVLWTGVLTVNVPSKLRPGDVNGLTSYVWGDACRHRILSGGTRFTVELRPTA